jgi:hypothetical protein
MGFLPRPERRDRLNVLAIVDAVFLWEKAVSDQLSAVS